MLIGRAPSGTLNSCGGNGRPCDCTGLLSLLGAPPPPPPDWNLRRFSASCRLPVEPIPLPSWFLLPPRSWFLLPPRFLKYNNLGNRTNLDIY